MVFLGLFHHQGPVPRGLRFVVFRIIGPMTFFNIKAFDNVNSENVATVSPNNKETITKIRNHTEHLETETVIMLYKIIKQIEGHDNEKYQLEWQIVSRILDRFLFLLNVIYMAIAFGYGYITLYTY